MNAEIPNVTFREAMSSAISYWERRRLVFNAVLVLVVVATFIAGWPVSARVLGTSWMLILFVLTVLANVVYCTAYIPDLAIQLSAFRETWLRLRWILFLIGTLLAACLTYFSVAGPFGIAQGNW
ncbi:MAG: hypothetical protein KDD84_02685 [Caldilineaceae bacterium]|nr:hypothetical protein [Caldilineaceae bacterium]